MGAVLAGRARTGTAKLLYGLSGLLAGLPAYCRRYEFLPGPRLGKAEWAWRRRAYSWGSTTVLGWSERMDPRHWEHWAYVPEPGWPPCAGCGGHVPPREPALSAASMTGDAPGPYPGE